MKLTKTIAILLCCVMVVGAAVGKGNTKEKEKKI